MLKINEYRNSDDTYIFDEDVLVTESNIIGSVASAKEIPHAGTVLSILESKWGYLFLVVLVSLLAFLYEISKAVEDIKGNKKDKENNSNEKEMPKQNTVQNVKKENTNENATENGKKENAQSEKNIDKTE